MTNVVKEILADTKDICDFLKRDRVYAIQQELIEDSSLKEVLKPKKMVENRMVTLHYHIESVRQQEDFVNSMKNNPKYKTFYKLRDSKEKKKIDLLTRRVNFVTFRSIDVLLNFTEKFVFAHKLCSSQNTPLAAYPLVVQGLLNGLIKAISVDDGLFDKVLGPGSAKEVWIMLKDRFNMDGRAPPGTRVGLIDEYHLWCLIVHPHAGEWRSRFSFNGQLRSLPKNMIAFYIGLDDDGGSVARDAMLEEFEVSHFFLLFFSFKY